MPYPRVPFGVLAAVAAVCVSAPAFANSNVWTCPKCGKTIGPCPPSDQRFAAWVREHQASCGAAQGSGAGPALSPDDQMVLGFMGMGAQWAGNELYKAIHGDPAEDARRAEEARLRAAEQARLEAERAAAEALRREQLHQNLMRALKLTGAGDVGLKGFDGEGPGGLKLKLSTGEDAPKEDGLKPQGTAFFGTGGGKEGGAPSGDAGDPMVVDLRNLRRGAYLIEQAAAAPPADAEILLDDALQAATGGGGPAIPLASCPAVGEEGLRAFQKANRDYRLAEESGRLAEDRHRLALKDGAAAYREAVLRRVESEREDPDGSRKVAFLESLARLREKREAEGRERAQVEAGRAESAFEDWFCRGVLRRAAKPDPVAATQADVLRRERDALQPGLKQRAEHFVNRQSSLAAEGATLEWMRENYRPPAPEIQAVQPRVQAVVDRLVAVSPYPGERIEVALAGMPVDPLKERGAESNACALSTHVVVGEQTLRDWQARGGDESDLAYILGHEITHVQNDHFIKGPARDRLVPDNAALPYPDLSDESFLLMPEHQKREALDRYRSQVKVREAWQALQTREERRAQESQGDRGGMALIVAAGYDPKGARNAMAAFAATEEAPPAHAAARAFKAQTADHPSWTTRYADLQRIWGPAAGEPLP